MGYGMIRRGPRGAGWVRAPRLSYELTYGPIPDGLWVLHKCDHPPCINPEHLFLGTPQDNQDDRKRKGRSLIGSLNHESKLTAETVATIRRRYALEGATVTSLAAEYGMARSSLKAAIDGKTWGWVP